MNFEVIYFNEPATIPNEVYASFYKLHSILFGEQYTEGIREEILSKDKPLVLMAISDIGQVIGFKLGYRSSDHEFYSWTGGVDPQFRKQGIASALIQKQHSYCRENGIKKVHTKTKNQFREMLILNLKNGFDIVDTYTNKKNEPVIILEKQL